jgi:redox-regulated HSP33 family molecular chaperone
VRGRDLLCEVETRSSSGKLVGDAATWQKTRRLASEGLDEDLHAYPETQHQVKSALLLDVAVSKGTTILKLLASAQGTPP